MEAYAYHLNDLGELKLWDLNEDEERERPCDLLVQDKEDVADWLESLDLHIQKGDTGVGYDIYI